MDSFVCGGGEVIRRAKKSVLLLHVVAERTGTSSEQRHRSVAVPLRCTQRAAEMGWGEVVVVFPGSWPFGGRRGGREEEELI